MRFPWANAILLFLLLAQLVSGFLGLVNGQAQRAWLLWWHGLGAYAIVILLLWKGQIIWGVLTRGRRWTAARISFLVLLLLLGLTLLSGLLWTFAGPQYLGGFSLISLHIYVALPLMALLLFHSWRLRWVLRRPAARDRRAFLRAGGLHLAGLLLWLGAGRVQRLLAGERRFTGSYETGSFSGVFPVVSWINDRPVAFDPAVYTLTIAAPAESLRLSYAELLAQSDSELDAILDCTGGFYTAQRWRGVPLARLLPDVPTARSVTVRSATGYYRRFPLDDIDSWLLATHVAGAPLSAGHGAPLRLVAPTRRGFEWVKWVSAIELSSLPALAQPPLPLP